LVSTLREKHRMTLFEDRAMTRIFETKREEVRGGCGKLCQKELYYLYFSPNNIRTMMWAGHVFFHGRE
jgi:hypothetical protein